MAKQSNTRVVTGLVRLSYANVWEPKSINGGDPKYSCSIIIPKSDTETVNAINAAIDCAIKEGIEAQMGGSAFSKALIKMEVASATGGDALKDFATVCGMTSSQFKTLFDSDPAAAFQAFIVGLQEGAHHDAGRCRTHRRPACGRYRAGAAQRSHLLLPVQRRCLRTGECRPPGASHS